MLNMEKFVLSDGKAKLHHITLNLNLLFLCGIILQPEILNLKLD